MNLIPLDLLNPGDLARIHEVEGDRDATHRLAEMGIRAGANVLMVKPGSPCILSVDDRRFTVRLDDSVSVLVDAGAVA